MIFAKDEGLKTLMLKFKPFSNVDIKFNSRNLTYRNLIIQLKVFTKNSNFLFEIFF